MMKILLAPDSFKGSLSSSDICKAYKEGILKAIDADIIEMPIADGGEGTIDAIATSTKCEIINISVTGPLGEQVNSCYGILKDGTAVIEMAECSGLCLVPDKKRNPLITTTYGVGEILKSALDKGCRNFIIGIGGSATNDGGSGMLQALGIKLLTKTHQDIGFGGGCLNQIETIDISGIDKRIIESSFLVASDVNNPLCGNKGASAVYGPQKGALPEIVTKLDNNLKHFADVFNNTFHKDFSLIEGAGAAGGLGFGLIAFLKAKLTPGINIVMEIVKMEDKIRDCDLVITGEGNTDFQTAFFGKAPAGIAKLAKKYNKPVIIISGGLGKNYKDLYKIGVTSLFSIVDKPMSLNDSMKDVYSLIVDRTEDIMNTISAFMKL